MEHKSDTQTDKAKIHRHNSFNTLFGFPHSKDFSYILYLIFSHVQYSSYQWHICLDIVYSLDVLYLVMEINLSAYYSWFPSSPILNWDVFFCHSVKLSLMLKETVRMICIFFLMSILQMFSDISLNHLYSFVYVMIWRRFMLNYCITLFMNTLHSNEQKCR